MYSYSRASQESLRQTFHNPIARIGDALYPSESSKPANDDVGATTAKSLEPPVASDDSSPTLAHRQLWCKRLEVARRYSDQGLIDEMTTHIRQTVEIIDNTLRYMQYQGSRGDESCSAHYIDGLAEYGERIKAVIGVLPNRCQAPGWEAAEPTGGGSGDPSTVV